MATHSSSLAWKVPWTEEPGGLRPRGHKESDTTERLTLSLFMCQALLEIQHHTTGVCPQGHLGAENVETLSQD